MVRSQNGGQCEKRRDRLEHVKVLRKKQRSTGHNPSIYGYDCPVPCETHVCTPTWGEIKIGCGEN